MMEIVELGKVVKLHGYLGLMKINTKVDKGFDIKKITKLYDENQHEYKVYRIFPNTDAVVVGLEGVGLEQAKSFVGSRFYVSREILSGKILFEDLKGSMVTLKCGKELGKIIDVQDYGTAEVISVMSVDGREFMFPNVKGVIESFDYKTKVLVLNEVKFKEVCDYED